MLKSECTVPTAKGEEYMVRLQKHFAHKITVETVGDALACHFDCGDARLSALPDSLVIEATSPSAEGLGDIKDTIERHLIRFAHADKIVDFKWSQ